MKKKQKNMTVIQQKMALTFSLRRREVVECQPMVSEVQERWPALFSSEEISDEFHRITSKDLLGTFNASLDKFVPGLLKLYQSKKGALGEKMEDLLDKLDEQTSDIVSHRKTAALRGLPIFLREDATKVFLKCLISDEFHRITSKDLLGTFNASLDKFVPGLLKLYQSKKGALGEKMEDLLDKLDEQTSDIVSHRKTAALRGLPIFLREDATKVFLKCLDTDILKRCIRCHPHHPTR
ncbi:uncharacterized protein LOC119016947 [Acanthopagrus latus]|uniref:uncharacterized protein LOC119016947 n=1 Tax=Acanthopagrus latus TaxID=8177 RepID=UPI00187C5616|nr:uncharacterized protein LOC119016947 [Acanthopagrus latus]XP_036949220.1 uncharacterized protein LOC119016947 [Acanthopagrus latus]